jgi:CDP-glucose 4,6-dehydratase
VDDSELRFWNNRRVLLTGHTGFKGAWTALRLEAAGAKVTGFALPPEGPVNLFDLLSPWPSLSSHLGDLNNADAIARAVAEAEPEIIIHMAAQAIVRRSYQDPVTTFATNVVGTARLLAAAMRHSSLSAILVVTSDKVYANRDNGRPFQEDAPLGGDDPYSASKAATEMVATSFRESFLRGANAPRLATARAGNVIGGGDWGEDRLAPDIIATGLAKRPVELRYPNATRPWQHVLDVVDGYLSYAQRLARNDGHVPDALNFGPAPRDVLAVKDFAKELQAGLGLEAGWTDQPGDHPPEKARLALDAGAAKTSLGWAPRLLPRDAIRWVATWHRAHSEGQDMRQFSLRQMADFDALPIEGTRPR